MILNDMNSNGLTGFTPNTFQFLKDINKNNYREWFYDHKHEYESELLFPLKAILEELTLPMYAIDSEFEMRPHRAISRIYRDTRFSKDKSPYKNYMWLVFQRPIVGEQWKDYPCFFLELKEDSYTIGLGLFHPQRKVMDNFRDAVSYNPEEFQRITQETVFKRGYTIVGEELKRPIKNNLSEYFQPWVQRKGVALYKIKSPGDEIYSSNFAKGLIEDFMALEWLYNFLKDVSSPDY